MPSPISPAIDKLFRERITDVVKALSKRSIFNLVIPSGPTQCPNCGWDSVEETSNGVYNGTGPQPFTGRTCPVCQGAGKLVTLTRRRIDATIQWIRTDKNGRDVLPQADLTDQFARVKILSRDRSAAEEADYFEIDGKKVVLVGDMFNRGLQSYVTTEFMVKRED